jgi:hypothetical protein
MTADEALIRVREYLDKGQAQEALALLGRCGAKSPLLDNARGVCLLRLGDYTRALPVFRELAFPRGSIGMDPRTPAPFRTNFVVAMLLLGHTSDAMPLLKQVPESQHPAVRRLREAATQWTSRQGILAKVLGAFGLHAGSSFTMDAPGDLEG